MDSPGECFMSLVWEFRIFHINAKMQRIESWKPKLWRLSTIANAWVGKAHNLVFSQNWKKSKSFYLNLFKNSHNNGGQSAQCLWPDILQLEQCTSYPVVTFSKFFVSTLFPVWLFVVNGAFTYCCQNNVKFMYLLWEWPFLIWRQDNSHQKYLVTVYFKLAKWSKISDYPRISASVNFLPQHIGLKVASSFSIFQTLESKHLLSLFAKHLNKWI